MAEKLWSGVLGPWHEDHRPGPEPDPVPMAQGGPITVDRHEGDVIPGAYDVGERRDFGNDLDGGRAHARASHRSGSPHVLLRLECHRCGRGATYYGRAEDAPPRPFTCDRCAGLDDAA